MEESGSRRENDSEEIIKFKVEIETLNQLLDVQEQVTIEQSNLLSQKIRELKEGNEFNRLILNSMEDIILIINVDDFNVMDCNDAFLKNLGFRKEEVIGKPCYELKHRRSEPCGPPDDICPLRDTFKTGGPVTVEHIHYTKDGDKKYMEVTTYPIKNKNGKIVQVVHVNRDITKRRKMEFTLNTVLEEAIKSREILSSMLADNNLIRERLEQSMKELKESNLQLIRAEKIELVGRMALGIAHEVKNPLGIILQGINYFERELPSEQKDNHEMLGMMKNSVKRGDSIVRALLNFSRAEELKMEQQDINTIIENSFNLMQYQFKLNSIEYVCELGKDLPKTLIDRGKIEQLFVNLFSNAKDAMPKGGKIYVRSYVAELKTPENEVGNRENDIFRLGEKVIIVEVEDTGSGMDEDIINKIFDPFFTTKSSSEGTGLGLSIVHRIIEMHGGLIKVESKKGIGTKFTIVLKIPQGEKGKGDDRR